MASLSSSGIGSGIDVNELVGQLVAAERSPKQSRLDIREAGMQAELSAIGVLKGALSDFQDSLSGLSLKSFQARTANSGDEEIFTASATQSASPSSYQVRVNHLAEQHKLISGEFSGSDAEVGNGVLSISTGGAAFDVTIDAGNSTLAGVRDAINNASGNTGVSAAVLNVDNVDGSATVSKLVLTAAETGTDYAISVEVTDIDGLDADNNGLSRLLYDPEGVQNLSEAQAALDAQIEIDGQTVTQTTNTITGLIEGVTLTLLQADPDYTHGLDVSLDTEGARGAIENFVLNFNLVKDTMGQLTSYNADSGETGILFGDSALRGIDNQLRRALSDVFSGLPDGVNSLAAIGIATDANGRLVIGSELQDTGDQRFFNTARLDAVLEENFDDVAQLFAGEDALVSRLDGLIDDFLASDGLLQARTEGLGTRIVSINDDRIALDARIESLETRLLSQFQAMDALVASLRTTSDFLTQQFESLQGIITGNK